MNDERFMEEALKEAQKAYIKDEVPIGCVIVKDGVVISRSHNTKVQTKNTINHAEIVAITKASEYLDSWYLDECELYVTLEPCMMCTGAIVNSRIKRVIFGTRDPKGGALKSNIVLNDIKNLNHYPEITEGILKEESSIILKRFFKEKRNKK